MRAIAFPSHLIYETLLLRVRLTIHDSRGYRHIVCFVAICEPILA